MTSRISEERPDIDLQSLCDRLREVFNAADDTPDELCTEAREAIEELWQERDASRALVTELRANASTWHRLVESFATIMDIDSSGSAEQLGNSIAEKIRGYQRMESELRALAERMRDYAAPRQWSETYADGCADGARKFLSELDSLLAAHDTQQADKTNG